MCVRNVVHRSWCIYIIVHIYNKETCYPRLNAPCLLMRTRARVRLCVLCVCSVYHVERGLRVVILMTITPTKLYRNVRIICKVRTNTIWIRNNQVRFFLPPNTVPQRTWRFSMFLHRWHRCLVHDLQNNVHAYAVPYAQQRTMIGKLAAAVCAVRTTIVTRIVCPTGKSKRTDDAVRLIGQLHNSTIKC